MPKAMATPANAPVRNGSRQASPPARCQPPGRAALPELGGPEPEHGERRVDAHRHDLRVRSQRLEGDVAGAHRHVQHAVARAAAPAPG